MIEVGEVAPDFALRVQSGETVRLSELLAANGAVVLAFYLLDFSGGWSSELSQFEAKYDEFRAMGAEIAGVSVDTHFCHAAFADRLKLRFPLFSDFHREVVGQFAGFFPEVAGYQKVNKRRILVLDPAGVVRWAWTAAEPSEVPDTESVREAVQEVVHS